MNKEAPVFSLWIDITAWLIERIDDFPKKVRFSLSNRLANTSLDILELIIEALYKRKKILLLREINIKLEKLRVLLRLCFSKKYLSLKQYEFIQEKLVDTGKMIGDWIRQRSKDERTL